MFRTGLVLFWLCAVGAFGGILFSATLPTKAIFSVIVFVLYLIGSYAFRERSEEEKEPDYDSWSSEQLWAKITDLSIEAQN